LVFLGPEPGLYIEVEARASENEARVRRPCCTDRVREKGPTGQDAVCCFILISILLLENGEEPLFVYTRMTFDLRIDETILW
jgi:hypothetical protein